MGEEREMTLEEWMGRLPTNHTANREYEALRTEIARLKATIKQFCADNEANGEWYGIPDVYQREKDLRKEVEEQLNGHPATAPVPHNDNAR